MKALAATWRQRTAVTTAMVATALGLGNAAVSAYWALGGTALLDTIGGEIEEWGRARDAKVLIALWAIVMLKASVALAALVLVAAPRRLPKWTFGRVPRVLSWIAAITLTIYGGLLTTGGLLVQADIIHANADADQRALSWHAFFWDPWFLIWGVAFAVCLWLTRRPKSLQRLLPLAR